MGSELRRDFHSTPDLVQEMAMLNASNKNHRSQEDISLLLGTNRNLPPPTHPPPPPPLVQVVKVDVSRGSQSEYDNVNRELLEEGIVSSFRPTANAKLYASPEDMKTVGYRSKSLPSHSSRAQLRKSQSMRNGSTFKPSNPSVPPPTKNLTNPYAQPIRASRSHSTAGTRERRKKHSTKSNVVIVSQNSADVPIIPDPDYSCSESENECGNQKDPSTLATRLSNVQLQPVENSGNSNTR